MNKKQEDKILKSPCYDFIFKKIFGNEGNEDITKDFISKIIGEKIKTIEFKNPNLLRESENDKGEELDVKAVLDNNTVCDIEIQVSNYHDDDRRILNYWAKMYRTSISKGKEYGNMQRTIVIYITSYDVDNLRELKEYKTKWKIIEEKYRKTVLTDVFEVDIIELSKVRRLIKKKQFDEEKDLKNWIEFLIDPTLMEEKEMGDLSEEIQKAYDEWQNMNLTEREKDIAERKYLDLVSRDYGMKYERKEGERNKAKEIAKKMLDENVDIKLISKFTSLSIEEIEKLK